jgi:hypothetical protein
MGSIPFEACILITQGLACMCIRDDQGDYTLACIEWYSPILEVDTWEALGLLHEMGDELTTD